MYLSILTLTLFGGCQDQAAKDENAKLTQKVADLERARDRLQADNDALKAAQKRADEEAAKAKKAQMFTKVGYKPGENKLTATFHTSMGDIACTLRPDEAPESVLNFIQLAMGEKEWTDTKGEKTTRPLYDGTIFHRVIPGFMIQGGDPAGNGTGGPGYEFADEVGSFTTFDHTGILAMANRGPNTQGSQFFITDGTPTHLNGKHTILGDCQNQDVVKAITGVERNKQDRPDKDVVLKHVDIAVK
jgi:peptidyl-prolyl cis-trans isomerase A (cyclophilin A)